MIIQYEHHGTMVHVKKKLKGRHKNSCLCFAPCELFKPNTTENCPIAEKVYALCVNQSLVLPVWECPQFRPKVKNDGA